MATVTFTYTLISVYDMREIDEFTGECIPLMAGEGNICNRCGREHAKVYVVRRDSDGHEFTVGSTCCKKLFGWEPEKEEARRLEKEARKQAQDRAHQRLVAIAQPIVEEVDALPLPRIIELERQEGRIPQTIWGAEGSKVKVWGLTSEGLTNERRDCFYSSWLMEQVHSRLEALYPPTSPFVVEDTNYNKRWKLKKVIRDLMGRGLGI